MRGKKCRTILSTWNAAAARHPSIINGQHLACVFYYRCVFAFVAFTLLLAFFISCSSNSSSPWSTKISTGFSTAVLNNSTSSLSKPTVNSPVTANWTENLVPKSVPLRKNASGKGEGRVAEKGNLVSDISSSIPKSSSPSRKNASGKGKGRAEEKGLVSNLSSSVLKKQRNGTSNAGVPAKEGSEEDLEEKLMNCDLFDGEWVRDESYPLYKPGSCPLIGDEFNCFANGRPDDAYSKLKWKPKGCSLPRLNGSRMLELLTGKRLIFVGDSLNRNMWQSLVCILRNSAKNQSQVYEEFGRHQFRSKASFSFVFKDYDCTIEFLKTHFLVQEWKSKFKNGLKKGTLRLDMIKRLVDASKSADVLIFNTGHWWTHEKTSKGKGYYQEGSNVYAELNHDEAFQKALTTWGRWVDANINQTKTLVLFRGYSASHFNGGKWNSGGQCDNETEPIKNKNYLSNYPVKMKVLENVLKGMKTPVAYLNVTRMTDYRKDGHPSTYGKQKSHDLMFQDCSHWCLPGVPDTWNELVYAELLRKQKQIKVRRTDTK